ncbi:MAG TPA: hypothetical protein VGM90_16260 [Kofleriaceae bacterium]|jgi:hypothetical protein
MQQLELDFTSRRAAVPSVDGFAVLDVGPPPHLLRGGRAIPSVVDKPARGDAERAVAIAADATADRQVDPDLERLAFAHFAALVGTLALSLRVQFQYFCAFAERVLRQDLSTDHVDSAARRRSEQ